MIATRRGGRWQADDDERTTKKKTMTAHQPKTVANNEEKKTTIQRDSHDNCTPVTTTRTTTQNNNTNNKYNVDESLSSYHISRMLMSRLLLLLKLICSYEFPRHSQRIMDHHNQQSQPQYRNEEPNSNKQNENHHHHQDFFLHITRLKHVLHVPTTVPAPAVTTRTTSHSGHVLTQDLQPQYVTIASSSKVLIHSYYDCGFDSSTTSTTLLSSHCSNSSSSG